MRRGGNVERRRRRDDSKVRPIGNAHVRLGNALFVPKQDSELTLEPGAFEEQGRVFVNEDGKVPRLSFWVCAASPPKTLTFSLELGVRGSESDDFCLRGRVSVDSSSNSAHRFARSFSALSVASSPVHWSTHCSARQRCVRAFQPQSRACWGLAWAQSRFSYWSQVPAPCSALDVRSSQEFLPDSGSSCWVPGRSHEVGWRLFAANRQTPRLPRAFYGAAVTPETASAHAQSPRSTLSADSVTSSVRRAVSITCASPMWLAS